jgi:hypothetical protein
VNDETISSNSSVDIPQCVAVAHISAVADFAAAVHYGDTLFCFYRQAG